MSDEKNLRRVALLGNHLPRQCGIATFTTDLSEAISLVGPDLDCFVLAMNDGPRQYDYPDRVRFELTDTDVAGYRRAADFLNVNAVDVVSVQHEYGIFGGKAGGHLLTLLRELRMPIVTTLHTILAAPNLHQRRVMDEITALSDRLVVMKVRRSEDRVQRRDDRHAQLPKQRQEVTSGLAAENPIFVLHGHDIDGVDVQKVRGAPVACHVGVRQLEANPVRIVVLTRTIVHRQNETIEVGTDQADRFAQIRGEGRDAALARQVVPEQRHAPQVFFIRHDFPSVAPFQNFPGALLQPLAAGGPHAVEPAVFAAVNGHRDNGL